MHTRAWELVIFSIVIILALTLVGVFILVEQSVAEEPTPTPTTTASPTPTISPTGSPTPSPTATATPSLNGSDWAYYQKGNVTSNTSCGNLSDFQMELTLYYGNGSSNGRDVYLSDHANSDFSDVRFTRSDGETLLDYWVQKYTENDIATVWVEFANISTSGTDFYIYYGNPNASSDSNGSSTFKIFNDGTSTDGWTVYSGGAAWNWSPYEGAIRCTSNQCSYCGGWSNLYCNTTTGTNYYVVETDIRAQDGNSTKNYQQGIGYSYGFPSVRWQEDSNKWLLRIYPNMQYSAVDNTFNATEWHEYRWVKNGSSYSEMFVDDDLKVTSNATNSYQTVGMYVWITGNNHWVDFDNFRIRNHCYPEPTFGEWSSGSTHTICQIFFNQSSYNTTLGSDVTITLNITDVEHFVSGQLDLVYNGDIIYLYQAPTDGIIYDGDPEGGDIDTDTNYRLLGSQGPYGWDGKIRLLFDCPWAQVGGGGNGPSGDGYLTQLTLRGNQSGATDIAFTLRLQMNQIVDWGLYEDYSYDTAEVMWGANCSVTVSQSRFGGGGEMVGGSNPQISGCSLPTQTPTVELPAESKPTPMPTTYVVRAGDDSLLVKYEDADRQFIKREVGDRVYYFHQRMIGDATVQGDYRRYSINKNTGEIIEEDMHWRDDLPETLPTILSKETIESQVKGEIRSSFLIYISPEYSSLPVEPTPKNPCWVVEDNIDGRLEIMIFDAVTGDFLGYGNPPQYLGVSISGPAYLDSCTSGWPEFVNLANTNLTAMGYTPHELLRHYVNPTNQSQIIAHIKSNDTAVFYEVAHGDSNQFIYNCPNGSLWSIVSDQVHLSIGNYSKMPFTFLHSCNAMCNQSTGQPDIGPNTISYEFRRGCVEGTASIGECRMNLYPCNQSCALNGSLLHWERTFYYELQNGAAVGAAFNEATLAFPTCEDCMRFYGDPNLKLVPNVKRTQTLYYGDANEDSMIDSFDMVVLQNMILEKTHTNPGGDASAGGIVDSFDVVLIRNIILEKSTAIKRNDANYDFWIGAGWWIVGTQDKWAKTKNITGVSTTKCYDCSGESGWTEANPNQYKWIQAPDKDWIWTIGKSDSKYTSIQTAFKVNEALANISMIGVTFSGFSETAGDQLGIYAYDFSSTGGGWKKIGFPSYYITLSNNIQTYTLWTNWGKVFANYSSGSKMYILFAHNTPNKYMNIDNVKLITIHP